MTTTLVLTLLRQRLSSPMRMLFLIVVSLFMLGAAVVTRSLSPLGQLGPLFAVVFAAGILGQELSSGTLQLALARPLTRRRYVLGRWLGAVAGIAAIAALLIGVGAILLARNGHAPTAAELGVTYAQAVLDGAATAAVLTAFSALLGGLGDLAILLLLYTSLPLLEQVAPPMGWTMLSRVLDAIHPIVAPRFALGFLAGAGSVSWAGLANASGVLVLGLGIAIAAMNRRELSYGSH